MSCQKCETIQSTPDAPKYYLRAGNGNLEIVGCSAHFQVLRLAYREFLKRLSEVAEKQDYGRSRSWGEVYESPEPPEPKSIFDHPEEGIGL